MPACLGIAGPEFVIGPTGRLWAISAIVSSVGRTRATSVSTGAQALSFCPCNLRYLLQLLSPYIGEGRG